MTSGTIKLLAALGAAIALASCATEVPPPAGMAEPAELPSAVSAAAETPRAAPAAPAPPAGLTAVGGDRSISLTWNDPGDAGIVSYEFRVRAPNDSDWRRWRVMVDSSPTTTSHLLPNLTAGVRYRVQVRARNAAGAGAAAEAAATAQPVMAPAATAQRVTAPAPPKGLTASGGDRSISLGWDDPGDASISGYEFRVRVAVDADWRNWRPVAVSTYLTNSHELRGLTNGALYRVQVRALNAAGAGEASETSATPGARDARGK